MKRELLLGCGFSREKRMGWPVDSWTKEFENLYTLDNNPQCESDLLCDLSVYDWTCIPFTEKAHDCLLNDDRIDTNFFHEIHAYEVLEHLGRQGDITSFFDTFHNIYRILVPDGLVFATCPSRYSGWLWGDPGHTRVIIPETLSFLDQTNYEECGRTTRSDYRALWEGDFKCLYSSDAGRQTHAFVLQAIKPRRIVKTHTEKMRNMQ
jgi:hypothetical protein